MHVGEAEVAAGVAVREFFMVIADEFHDRGMQIVNMDFVLNGPETEFVGRTVDVAAANSTAGHPHREAPVIMITAIDFSGICAFLRKFDYWCAAKFATPDHQCFFE